MGLEEEGTGSDRSESEGAEEERGGEGGLEGRGDGVFSTVISRTMTKGEAWSLSHNTKAT